MDIRWKLYQPDKRLYTLSQIGGCSNFDDLSGFATIFMEKILNLKKLQNGSDIRGIALEGVPGEVPNLCHAEAKALSLGFLYWLCKKTGKKCSELKISIGHDVRLSGHSLKKAFIEAVAPYDTVIYDCGLASTPAMFMSTIFEEFNCDGAVMITASHLPFNRNGFKYFDKDGGLNKEDIKDIISYGETSAWESSPLLVNKCCYENATDASFATESCNVKEADLMACYTAHLRQLIIDGVSADCTSVNDGAMTSHQKVCYLHDSTNCDDKCEDSNNNFITSDCPDTCNSVLYNGAAKEKPLAGMHIVVDAGNGAGGFFATDVLEPLGADISGSCFLDPDGRFPNHAPNPEDKAAMACISQAVVSSGAELGLIFDTDVDRSAAVDNTGKEISRNGIVAMAAALISDQYPGSTIVTDSITSNQLETFLTKNLGLCHLRYKRGYKNVINKGIELNESGTVCPLAIETSGHAAFKDNYFLDDGAYLATKIVIKAALLHQNGLRIHSVLADLTEPLEATEIRFPILAEDFAPYGDKILEDLTAFTVKCGINGDNIFGISLVEPNYEGVRIDFNESCGGGWCLLRKSLHDPIMPLNIESDQIGGIDKIKDILRGFLSQYTELDISKL